MQRKKYELKMIQIHGHKATVAKVFLLRACWITLKLLSCKHLRLFLSSKVQESRGIRLKNLALTSDPATTTVALGSASRDNFLEFKKLSTIRLKLLPVACCLLPTPTKRLFQQALLSLHLAPQNYWENQSLKSLFSRNPPTVHLTLIEKVQDIC